MSERDEMFGSTQGKGDKVRPTDNKKFRNRFPSSMGPIKKGKKGWDIRKLKLKIKAWEKAEKLKKGR